MKKQPAISVVVLEDEKNFRENIDLLLNGAEGICCLATYSCLTDFLGDFDNINPNIFWVDLQLGDGSGIEAIQHVKGRRPEALCLVCSFFDSEDKIFEALKNGADGYLIKSDTNANMLNAVRELYQGGAPISPGIARKVLSFFQNPPKLEKSAELASLTGREMEILQELAKGRIYKEIAHDLYISPDTVKKHVQHIYTKLHVGNKTEAVIKYMNLHGNSLS